jgi:hypothetical protein
MNGLKITKIQGYCAEYVYKFIDSFVRKFVQDLRTEIYQKSVSAERKFCKVDPW